MRKALLGGVFMAAAAINAVPSSSAEPGDSFALTEPMSILDSVSAENVSEVLREMNAQQVQVHDVEGTKVVTFVDGNIPYNMVVTLCDVRPGKCVGLVVVVALETGTLKFPPELINSHNKDYPFVCVVQLDNQRIGMGHAFLVDSGVTKKNLAMNIGTFAASVRESMKYLTSQIVASNEAGTKAPFDKVKFNPGELRPVFLAKEEAARMANAVSEPVKERLRKLR